MKKLYYLFLVLLISCGQEEIVDQVIKVEYLDAPIHSDAFLAEYEPVMLESPSQDAMITDMSRVVLAKDRIFVFDRIAEKVIAFDRSGKFINSTKNMIGRAGNEFLSLIDIAVDDNKKLLFMQCDNPYKMSILDYDLNFVSQVEMSYYCREIAVDDNYIYGVLPTSRDRPSEKQYDYFVAIDRNNIAAKPKVLLQMDNVLHGVGAQQALSSSNGAIYVCGRFDDAIYEVKNGEIVKDYKLDFGERALPASVKTEDINSSQFQDKYIGSGANGKIYYASMVCASDSILLFSTNQIFVFVLNKHTMTCKGYEGFRSNKLPMTTTSSYPTKSDENNVIYKTENRALQNYMTRYREGKATRKLDDKLMAIAEKVDDNSNPVLIIWDIK